MLLKNTPLGDIEVQSTDERSARKFLHTLIANGQIANEKNPKDRFTTHEIVTENGVRTLRRIGFASKVR